MTNFAELVLTADSSGLKAGEGALDSIAAKGAATESRITAVSKKMSASLTGFGTSAQKAATASASLATASQSVGFREQAADIAAAHMEAQEYAAQMEALRAKFNPLFAVSKRYEAELREIAQAEQLGAISAMEAAQARDRAAASLSSAATQARVAGTAMQTSTFHTANLAAQFNDIGVMLAAGQSPLMLAVQQGTQLNQVFAQMRATGQSAFAGIVAGIRSMISPMSIATLAIIAGGAALVQWGVNAVKSADNTGELKEAMDALKESTSELADDLEQINLGLDNQAQLLGAKAIREAKEDLAEINAELDKYESQLIEGEALAGSVFAGVITQLRAQRDEKLAIISAVEEELAANIAINDQLEKAKNLSFDVVGAAVDMAESFKLSLNPLEQMAARAAAVAGSILSAAQAFVELQNANRVAGQDSLQYSGRGTLRGDEENTPSSTGRFVFEPPKTSGGGGGGQSESLRKHNELLREAAQIFDKTRTAAEEYAAELEDLNELRDLGYLSEETHARAVRMLGEEFNKASSEAESLRGAAASTFAEIVTDAESASDAISGLLSNFANIFANAAFGGLLKSVGLFDAFGSLLSFDGGGHTGTGARSGGVDGKGGFPAILHPNETVIDHTKGQRARGQSEVNVTVSVNNDGELQAYVERVSGEVSARTTRQGLQQYDRTVLPKSVRRANSDPRRIG